MSNKLPPTPPPSRDPTGGAKDKYATNYIIMIVFCLFALIVLASYPAQSSEICKDWANAAEKVMTARMEHESQEAMLQRLNNANLSKQMTEGFTTLINAAFNVPMYHKIEDKLVLIEKFGDAIFIECLNNNAENV